MAEIVNLRKARKRKSRQEQEQIAAERRADHGRSKAQRDLDEARATKACRELDAHRLSGSEE
jgi:hypothetical protein